jgi:hypothetical protein
MKVYTGKDISQESLERLTKRLTSEVKLPRTITMKQIIAIYSLLANGQFTPKQLHALLPDITLKKIRTAIHLMLRYSIIRAHTKSQ